MKLPNERVSFILLLRPFLQAYTYREERSAIQIQFSPLLKSLCAAKRVERVRLIMKKIRANSYMHML